MIMCVVLEAAMVQLILERNPHMRPKGSLEGYHGYQGYHKSEYHVSNNRQPSVLLSRWSLYMRYDLIFDMISNDDVSDSTLFLL